MVLRQNGTLSIHSNFQEPVNTHFAFNQNHQRKIDSPPLGMCSGVLISMAGDTIHERKKKKTKFTIYSVDCDNFFNFLFSAPADRIHS